MFVYKFIAGTKVLNQKPSGNAPDAETSTVPLKLELLWMMMETWRYPICTSWRYMTVGRPSLRKAVTNSLKTHPLKMQWIKSLFMGKSQKYAKFVKEQSIENTFIDNYGIIVVATADYLGVNYHIVGTSNTEKVPVTKLHDDCPNRKILHVGYYQDTTDQDGGPKKLGHYQSLEIVQNVDVPCCSIVVELEAEKVRDELVEKIQSEEMVLKTFLSDRTMVRLSLERIHALPSVSLNELFNTNISHILYNDVRNRYKASTFEGKLCRKILKKFQNLCRNSPGFQDEDLPQMTDAGN